MVFNSLTLSGVIARLDRAIQYPRPVFTGSPIEIGCFRFRSFNSAEVGQARLRVKPGDDSITGCRPIDYFSAGAGSAAWRINSGYCNAANTKVIGTKPNNLKLIQKSVDWVRQIASLSTASARKNSAQRNVSLRQPSGVRWNIESKRIARNGLSKI